MSLFLVVVLKHHERGFKGMDGFNHLFFFVIRWYWGRGFITGSLNFVWNVPMGQWIVLPLFCTPNGNHGLFLKGWALFYHRLLEWQKFFGCFFLGVQLNVEGLFCWVACKKASQVRCSQSISNKKTHLFLMSHGDCEAFKWLYASRLFFDGGGRGYLESWRYVNMYTYIYQPVNQDSMEC